MFHKGLKIDFYNSAVSFSCVFFVKMHANVPQLPAGGVPNPHQQGFNVCFMWD